MCTCQKYNIKNILYMDMYGIYAVNTHCDPNGGDMEWRMHATNGII